jgi:hypothetical protein
VNPLSLLPLFLLLRRKKEGRKEREERKRKLYIPSLVRVER